MIASKSLRNGAAASRNNPAYSIAAAGSCMEQGPTTTNKRSSRP